MKKTITLLLTLCLLLGLLPTEAVAFAGDIYRAGEVKTVKMADGSLSLQNGYVHVTLHKLLETYSYLTVVPAAKPDEDSMWNSQTPYCNYTTYKQGVPTTEGMVVSLKKMEFVTSMPNGESTKAIKAEYDLLSSHSHVAAQMTVYYEIVQLKESGTAAKEDTWGVLATVGDICVEVNDQVVAGDPRFTWGYYLNGFTSMGHRAMLEETGGPAIKLSRTTVPEVPKGETPKITTESSTITAPVENLDTKTVPKGYSSWGDVDGVYITEAYVDSYPWANPFVGLSDYYGKEITGSSGNPIRVDLAQTVSIQPSGKPRDSLVSCESYIGATHKWPGDPMDNPSENYWEASARFLWGFRDLKILKQDIPSEPDKVDPAIYAKRLAVFSSGSGVTVEHVADDAALSALKKRYGDPVALINGDYESKNGEAFTFTGGAALLSPSVTATWGSGGKLIIHKNGTVEQSGVSLSAPTFKFYQPTSGADGALGISLTKKGFAFDIDPANNAAIVYVDIPYATVKLEEATADAAGNLVFSGNIGFQTIFDGAKFTMEKLGYGLKGNEFKVNGVKATGKFSTEKMLSLELANVEGEVNTFKGEERYAFELELNVFDLFETEAKLALERANDGSLIPDELWFFVKAEPGILLIPPVPVGRLTGGGAGFKDLAATVKGNYFAIPPIKLRGAVSGAYLQLVEGRADVVLGPSEISLKASDVGIVGFGKYGQFVDSFGYALKLTGQERKYKGTPYQGVYLVGSEELTINLPSKNLDVFALESSLGLGAFGGTGMKSGRKHLYLGIGANGTVNGRVQIPKGFPFAGTKFGSADIQLIVGGQTEIPIRNVSVSEGMKQALNNIDAYLGAMAQTENPLFGVRVWVLVPKVLQTNFRYKEGWGIEGTFIKKLPEWDWSSKGVEPVVQAVSLEDGEEFAVMLAADPPDAEPCGGGNVQTITVNANADETPYILLAFDESVSEEDIKQALIVTKKDETDRIDINWVGEDGQTDPTAEIYAGIDLIKNNKDGEEYRVALLRLKDGGTYVVNTGDLEPQKNQTATVTPFEKLELSLRGNQVSGKVKYAEEDTKYVLRTYFAEKEGGADYLIDEQIDVNPNSISVDIPNSGTHAPSGEYYVTSFLMTEKTTTVADENGESENVTALMAIDSQTLGTVLYTNTQQPNAPTDVTLTFVGNEVMRAAWEEVPNVDGYRVTVYQKDGSEWKDTGFGYDLKKPDENGQPATSINMALTVGGEETENSKNLSADETYKIGVSAYKEEPYFTESAETGSTENPETGTSAGEETSAAEGSEGSTAGSGGTSAPKALTAKYYSTEKLSSDVFLPKYQELTMTLNVNGNVIDADESGVYNAYVGKNPGTLTVTADGANSITVTRMDTGTNIVPDETASNTFAIPNFTGSLMLKIDGTKGQDVTSVFLLVSRDETPPVLTLSDPIFFADQDTGAYTITGMADAGSEILYGENGRTQAAGDGSFAIHDKLEDERETNASLYLRAKDSAGNESAQQLALITRQTRYAVTVNGSYDAQNSGAGSYAAGSVVTVRAGSRSGYTFDGWTSGSNVVFDDPSAAETTFTMPEGSVTVTANWSRDGGSSSSGRDDSDPRYAVGIPDKTENGSVSVSPKNASQGDRVTVTVKPDAGYELDSLKVFDKNGKELELTDKGDGRFTFIMPAGRVEVKATFTEEVKISPFRDVSTDAYYYEAVKWAQKKGITGGIGNDLFGPYQPCTRAQIVTFLWRAAGSPVVNYAMDLTDVPGDAYYAEAVRWALSQGITTGTADGRFSPNAPCTRAQAVTFLFRASKASADGAPAFSDVAADAYYAEAVKWATDNGITNGTTSSTFSPAGGCTRAQIVTFLWRLYAEK
ncbi:S-layer homology domain-containing protein [Dysosmobacter sp.]|uniref:S-layer homology domain-containing protein n=1 Tax=Dysosmobacter sp. TaxID=2591382 RepID=UPI00307E7360